MIGKIRVLDLFSGIGGFSLGLERAGMKTVAFVEIDEFCQKVLKKHWPDIPIFSDIRNFGKEVLNEKVDVICGGFPCQPFSVAGKRGGRKDNRYLWNEMFRVIQEFKPTWVIAENVHGILSIEQGIVFEQVCLDLESENYEVQSFIIPACAVNAPHRRYRVWIIANSERMGWEKRPWKDIQFKEQIPKRQNIRNIDTERFTNAWEGTWFEVTTKLCRVGDGVSNRMDRLRCLGNAVVPQIVEIIGRVITEIENNK